MKYQIRKLDTPLKIDGDWTKPQWRKAQTLQLDHYMGDKPAHRPKTQARVLYDDHALYVIFRVEDRYVRAVAPKHGAQVHFDSCVEFFFLPGTDPSIGYFNMETNCGGTMVFDHQIVPRKNPVAIDLDSITVFHSLPKIVEPELKEPTTWSVEYRIPLELLKRYGSIIPPAPSVVWRGNFYKCGDQTSHPHWLTWAPVEASEPDFHLPQFFDELEFA